MATPNAPADVSAASPAPAAGAQSAPAPPSWPWRRAALFLSGAAQLITISALVGADPLAVTWWSLLLAIVPAPVAALAAFAPVPVNMLAAAAGVLILVAGIAGGMCIPGCSSSRRWWRWLSVPSSCGANSNDPAEVSR